MYKYFFIWCRKIFIIWFVSDCFKEMLLFFVNFGFWKYFDFFVCFFKFIRVNLNFDGIYVIVVYVF